MPARSSPASRVKVTSASDEEVSIEGGDAAKFREIAALADSRCPVSNAYRGTMQITVDAKVA